MQNSLSLLKIIDGLSKSINIAKKIIPIYKEVKPLINKSEEYIKKLQNINVNKQPIKKEITTQTTSTSKPIFFQ